MTYRGYLAISCLTLGVSISVYAQPSQPALEISNNLVRTPGVPDGTLAIHEPTVRLHGLAHGVSGILRVTWESDRSIGGLASIGKTRVALHVRWETEPISLQPGKNRIKLQAVDSSNQAATAFVIVNYTPLKPSSDIQPPRRRTTYHGKTVTVDVKNGRAIYQGDIDLGNLDALENAPDLLTRPGSRPAPRAATLAAASGLWPTVAGVATVPYTGASGNITTAIATFNAAFSGVIQWVPKTSETNYVVWALNPNDHSGACESNIGMSGGAQNMTGSIDCATSTLLHEMGHAVGLWHEQSRMDRNSYISVMYSYIDKPNASNFDQELSNEVDSGYYNYASIMHYPATLFGKFGVLPTIESIPTGIPLSNTVGYTAGDIDAIKRLYGRVPTSITIDSNPSGAQVLIDGVTMTTPQTFNWALNSSHTLDLPADPQTIGGQLCIFGRWNNQSGTARTNPITITPGNSTIYAPSTAPAATVYSANFIPIYQVSMSPSITNGIAEVFPPSALTFNGKNYYTNREAIELIAVPNTGFGFYEWLNISLFNLWDNANNVYVGNDLINAQAFFQAAPILTVTSNGSTIPSASTIPKIAVKVDGNYIDAPQNFTWTASHAVDGTPQNASPETTNISYAFSNWSDGGALAHSVAPPANHASQIITANFLATYRALVYTNPTCGNNTVTPSGDSNLPFGTQVNYRAVPGAGYTFVGWSGDFATTLSGANPFPAIVDDQILATANFNVTGTSVPLTITGVSPASAGASPNGLDLTITGTGFINGANPTYGFFNNNPHILTYLNSTSVIMHLNPGEISSAGYNNIQIDNNPGNCPVFANWTYPVTITAAAPSLTIAKVHSGNFAMGQSGAQYTITVSNAAGASSTSGTVTVTEVLPFGLGMVSMSGASWNCVAASGTCTQNNFLAGGASYPPITVTVDVAANAPASITNQASVSGGGSAPATASDITTITPVASQLKFTTQPTNGSVGTAIPPVVVQVQDINGNPVSGASLVTLTSNPLDISSSTVSNINGVATFNNLVFDMAGTYRFSAASGAAGGLSNSFTIAGGAPTVVISSPAPGAVISSGTAIVNGLAFDNVSASGTAISRVQVKVDNIVIGNAAYGNLYCFTPPGRQNICPNAGFSYSVSLALLTPGTHTITVSATDAQPDTGSASVNVTVAPLLMTGTKVAVLRSSSQFLQDVNGNGVFDGPDRFLTTFAPPGGVLAEDMVVIGDWNGDGHAKVGFYRPSGGTWWLDANNDGVYDAGDYTYSFGGVPGDLPMVGDWSGVAGVSTHKTCIGIYRAQGSVWLLDLNCNGTFDNTPTDAFFPYGGLAGDIPVVGNFMGGNSRVGVVRKYAPAGVPQGEPFFWVFDGGNSSAGNQPADHPTAGNLAFAFGGLAGDQFVVGDWLGTGVARAGVFRNGLWVLDANGLHNPDLILSYGGVAGDKAVPGKW